MFKIAVCEAIKNFREAQLNNEKCEMPSF